MTKSVNYQQIEKDADAVPTVGFNRLHKDAIIPTKGHNEDSGFDLYALEDTVIYPGQTVVVKTGVAVSLPEGYDATCRPRSGNTSKTKLRVQLGTIDNKYIGEVGVIVDNIEPSYSPLISLSKNFSYLVARASNLNLDKSLDIIKDFEKSVENTFFSKELHTLKSIEESDQSYPIGTYLVKKGDKIAQLVVHPYYDKDSIEVEEIAETGRGVNGFGSTGVN